MYLKTIVWMSDMTLEQYSHEISVLLTLDELIESHRRQRRLIIEEAEAIKRANELRIKIKEFFNL